MDKLLNLVAAAEDDNPGYDIFINTFKETGFDFYLVFTTYHESDSSESFKLDKILEALKDFSKYTISTYSHGADRYVRREGKSEHVIEIMVKR